MKKGLGRGFDSLIPTNLIDETFDPTAQQDDWLSQLRQLPIDMIIADPEQPRRFFEEAALEELAASIRVHGILQPLVVTRRGDHFEIVAGERRWRAAQLAGLTEVPALVRTVTGQHRLELSLIENLQRRDLNPLETATAYVKLRDQFNLTLDEIGERVGGRSSSTISNTMRLLKLPKVIQEAVFEGRLSEGQARPLVGMPEADAVRVMERAIAEEWSARRVEQAVALWKQAGQRTIEQQKKPDELPHAAAVEALTGRLKSAVRVQTNTRGAGKIIIPFKNARDFERIRQLIDRPGR